MPPQDANPTPSFGGFGLKGAQADEVEKEFRGSIQQISIESLETNGSREEPIITVQIPDAPNVDGLRLCQ